MPCSDVVISIKPKYVADILAGRKKIELRRRSVRLEAGVRIWIYSTTPKASFEATAKIAAIHHGTPREIARFLGQACVTQEEYADYFRGARQACAIELRNIIRLQQTLSLEDARSIASSFHPPQFWMNLEDDAKLLAALRRRCPVKLEKLAA